MQVHRALGAESALPLHVQGMLIVRCADLHSVLSHPLTLSENGRLFMRAIPGENYQKDMTGSWDNQIFLAHLLFLASSCLRKVLGKLQYTRIGVPTVARMDPLSITASTVTLIQASGIVGSKL